MFNCNNKFFSRRHHNDFLLGMIIKKIFAGRYETSVLPGSPSNEKREMFNFLPANYDTTQYILDFLVNKASSPGSRRSNPKYLKMNSRLSKVKSNVNLTLKI